MSDIQAHLGTSRGLTSALDTDRHQHIHLALYRLVRLHTWVDECYELIKDSLEGQLLVFRLHSPGIGRKRTFCTTFFLLTSFPPAFSASSRLRFTCESANALNQKDVQAPADIPDS